MKIAITGHTAGIGQALAREYANRGHEIIGLSKREGNNIRNIPKICDQIQPCDMFINNAQAGYAQTELLFEMAHRWVGQNKHIMLISSMMTQDLVAYRPELDQYRVQKICLEQAVQQIRFRDRKIKLTLVRPGNIATSADKIVPPAADVENWAKTLIEILQLADQRNLCVPEISLGPTI